MSKGHIHNHSA